MMMRWGMVWLLLVWQLPGLAQSVPPARDPLDHISARAWLDDPSNSLGPEQVRSMAWTPFTGPLGRGFLSGSVTTTENLPADDFRRTLPRFQGDDLQKNLQLVRALDTLAAKKSCTTSQLSLAWVLAKGDDLIPIPGTKRRTYLESNAASADIDLTAADVAELDAAFPMGAASGARYPASLGAMVDAKREPK